MVLGLDMVLGLPYWLPQISLFADTWNYILRQRSKSQCEWGWEEDLRIDAQLGLKFQQKKEAEPRREISESASYPARADPSSVRI